MSTQTGDVLFGRAMFGGFNRRDVIDYIDAMQRDAAAQSADAALMQQLEAARRERDALLRETQSLREQITQLQAQLKVEQTTNELLDGQRRGEAEEDFVARAQTVTADDPKELSMRDVDEMVKKYFG